jgi:hypothetical protein
MMISRGPKRSGKASQARTNLLKSKQNETGDVYSLIELECLQSSGGGFDDQGVYGVYGCCMHRPIVQGDRVNSPVR